VSIRLACRVLSVDTSTYHYKSRRRGQADLEQRIKEIAETRMRYGYRRVHVVLQREGWMTNIKRIYRLYTALGLQLRNKIPKRRVKAKLRNDRCPALQPNQTWAMDFVHDQLAMGRKIRILTVVDIFSKFSPVVDPRLSYRSEDVVRTLEGVCGQVGNPKTIRVDQGSEFVSRDLDLWAYQIFRFYRHTAIPIRDGSRPMRISVIPLRSSSRQITTFSACSILKVFRWRSLASDGGMASLWKPTRAKFGGSLPSTSIC
jgi:putative transposase